MTSEPEGKRQKVPPDDGAPGIFEAPKNDLQTLTVAQLLESLRTFSQNKGEQEIPQKTNQHEKHNQSDTLLQLQTSREEVDHLRKNNQQLKQEVERKDIFIQELLKKLHESQNHVMELQSKLRGPGETKSNPTSPHSSPGPTLTTPLSYETTTPHLKVIQQPPSHAVYQRILKPFPTVAVMGVSHLKNCQNLFVEVNLVKQEDQDSGCESSTNNVVCKGGGSALEGEKRNLIGGQLVQRSTESQSSDCLVVVFKKLKVLTTNSQQGTDFFLLKFTLKRYVDNIFETVPGVPSVYSDPFEVFSHTLYLKDKGTKVNSSTKRKNSSDNAVTAPATPLASSDKELPTVLTTVATNHASLA